MFDFSDFSSSLITKVIRVTGVSLLTSPQSNVTVNRSELTGGLCRFRQVVEQIHSAELAQLVSMELTLVSRLCAAARLRVCEYVNVNGTNGTMSERLHKTSLIHPTVCCSSGSFTLNESSSWMSCSARH